MVKSRDREKSIVVKFLAAAVFIIVIIITILLIGKTGASHSESYKNNAQIAAIVDEYSKEYRHEFQLASKEIEQRLYGKWQMVDSDTLGYSLKYDVTSGALEEGKLDVSEEEFCILRLGPVLKNVDGQSLSTGEFKYYPEVFKNPVFACYQETLGQMKQDDFLDNFSGIKDMDPDTEGTVVIAMGLPSDAPDQYEDTLVRFMIINKEVIAVNQSGFFKLQHQQGNGKESPDQEESTTIAENDTKNTMDLIDGRVAWIKENLDGFTSKDEYGYTDYFYGKHLICRDFYKVEDCPTAETEEDDNEYTMYYDEAGKWIYADIVRYRSASYSMYIQDNTIFHVEAGPFETGGIAVSGDLSKVLDVVKEHTDFSFILEDYGICLGNVKDYAAQLEKVYESSSEQAAKAASQDTQAAGTPEIYIINKSVPATASMPDLTFNRF